jgi:hypothetical protein
MADPHHIVLSGLDRSELEEQARSSCFPKWATLCLLRAAGLPTLDACYIRPTTTSQPVRAILKAFADRLNATSLLVRSDGGIERQAYYKGGSSVPIDVAVELCSRLLGEGRAVIAMEPTNRFNNRLTGNVLADKRGTLVVELLGPGYDVGDLNRGGIRPQLTIQASVKSWDRFAQLGRSDIIVSTDFGATSERRRVAERLHRLGTDVLPAMGLSVNPPIERFVQAWLVANGQSALWEEWRPTITIHEIRTWHEQAFMIGLAYPRRWNTLVYSFSRLENRRLIYWDVVDGARKYGL